MLEKEQKEDAKMLYGFSKFSKNKSKLKSTVKEETKEILLHNLLTKYSLEKPKFKEKIFESSKMILKSQVFSPIFSNSSLVLNSAKKLKKNIIEPEPESPNLEYPTNHKEGVRITVYSKNAEKMQRNLNEKVNLDNVFKQGNLKLGKGQIKYVKNGRIYVFNLNENVILHKDKIIQIQNKNDNDKNKNETEDDLFTFLIKKNLSPTEYFFNKKQQSKNPYFKKT